ncbi:ComGF family competence protein [Companilactobacillus tucceti]|nr:ComGF family competence protein [Companilactobacillus tucceti]
MCGKRSGMMLSESLIALLVTVLVMMVLQQTLKVIKHVPDNLNTEQIRWHMTNEYIQDKFQNEELKSISSKKLIFDDKDKSGATHVLEFYQNMLRVRSEQGGHVPLVIGIRSGSFKVRDDLIIIKMINDKNQTSEMHLINVSKRNSD